MTPYEEYLSRRQDIINQEENMWVGASISLSEKEQQVNKILMKYKHAELAEGFKKPHRFPPAIHFFKAKPMIEKSEIFKILKELPKGGCLHCHDTAIASSDYVMTLMDTEGLHGCLVDGRLELKVFKSRPDSTCNWKLISELRQKDADFDNFLLKQLTIYEEEPEKAYRDINTVWTRFIQSFTTANGVICYKPVFAQYFYQVLTELYEDNVKYLEFRGLLPEVYDDSNNVLGPSEVLKIYYDTWLDFKKEHKDFYDCKFIYAPIRYCDKDMVRQYIKTAMMLKEQFPDFVAGFDLVGQEDLGQPLREFSLELFKLSKKMNLFLHAAETNWNGFEPDINIIDAVLFDTKRIGHGYGLIRHPIIMKMVCEKDIAVEVCPISNQVLKLVEDARNHPACVLLNNGCPVVICCDDPGMWLAKGLSYDWYIAFMGMSPRDADLRLLKQLAQNAIMFSSMSMERKQEALAQWTIDWNEFLNLMLKRYKPAQ